MRTISIVSAIVLVAVTGVTVATGTVAADGHETTLGAVLDGPDEDESTFSWASGGTSAVWAGWEGGRDRAEWWVSNNLLPESMAPDRPAATDEAEELTTYFNANSGTLEEYASSRKDWTSNQTVEITLHIGNETATRYIVATAQNGNLTSSEMVNSTTRTADHTADLCGYAAEQSKEELKHFVKEYAQPGKDVDTAYKARLKGRYNQDVETTVYPTNGECGGDA